MRIAVVASPVAPLRPAQLGGAQAFVSDLASGLASRGHEVALFCAEGSAVAGVRLVTVPVPPGAEAALIMPGGPAPARSPAVDSAIETLFELVRAWRPDTVSQHAFDAPAFRHEAGAPLLHTLHMPPLVPAVVEAVKAAPPQSLATVSRSCLASWRAAGVEVGRVLYNGVPDLPLGRDRVEMRALIAGRISPEKGVEQGIAAGLAAGLAVTIAGAHYDPGYVVDLGKCENLGSLARDELHRVMSRSAVTVCAVRWDEPFGMVAAEAQMAGCPVAAYRRGALPEVVEEGVTGWLAEQGDVKGLAEAIRRCLSLDRGAVRASARRRLGLEAALDRYEAAFEELSA